ncbi:MAG: hypothetical protein LDLANPLL_02328 [Turneriella sp.]|nr:hypothetical protein [Turneriella sp.]
MQTLGEILRYNDPLYLRYLSRKTQFLITQEKSEYIHRFWQHLIIEYHPQLVIPELSSREKKYFETLLKYFGHDQRVSMRTKYQKLEKKIPWVLMHPEGGYFIPYEIIKTLMPQQNIIAKNYLFQLLYTMPKAEQASLRAHLAHSDRSREALTLEKHPLDRALSLYIFTAERERGKVVKRRAKQRSIWQFLHEEFPRFTNEINEWQYLMQTSQKGFYRSLSLLRGSSVHFLKKYVSSLSVVPIATRRHRLFPVQNLRFAIPQEFLPEKIRAKSR